MGTKNLEEIVQYLEDIQEIETMFAKWSFAHGLGAKQEEVNDMWSKKAPGVRSTFVQMGLPQFIKMEDGTRGFGDAKGVIDKEKTPSAVWTGGVIGGYPFTTSVIEVAADGKTAKAVLISPAIHTKRTYRGELQALWHWVKAGYDLVKEDGKWKFWHYRLWELFCCPYERSWVEAYVICQNSLLPDELYRTPNYIYSPVTAQVLAPVPPEPYETFDKRTAYIY